MKGVSKTKEPLGVEKKIPFERSGVRKERDGLEEEKAL